MRSLAFHLLDEASAVRHPVGRWLRFAMIAVILTNTTMVILATVDDFGMHQAALFLAAQWAILAIFALDYVSRIWIAPERFPAAEAARARFSYLMSPLGIVDLLAVMPGVAIGIIADDKGIQALFDMFATLKLLRYFSAVETIAAVVRNERRAIGAALGVMFVLLIFASTVMYMFERAAQPDAFASIPHAMWWGVVTLTTTGYGDLVPITAQGRIFGALVTILGLGMFALPAGILANGFAAELKKRDFVVTWNLISQVPLFKHLPAAEIAELAQLLAFQHLPERYAVVRRGEEADGMYFILSGNVVVEIGDKPISLGAGHFFGEIALVLGGTRTATVTTVEACELLALSADDFKKLAESHPTIRDEIARVAEERYGKTKA